MLKEGEVMRKDNINIHTPELGVKNYSARVSEKRKKQWNKFKSDFELSSGTAARLAIEHTLDDVESGRIKEVDILRRLR